MKVTSYDRVVGSLYGMATGDALGVPTSFLSPQHIKNKWGWVDTFYPPEKGHIFHDGLKPGEYTDDTEQALALIKSFVNNKQVVPEDIVKELLCWADRVKGKYVSPLGPSTAKALKAISQGAAVFDAGKWGNTNGSAMRISPLGIIHGLRKSSLDELIPDVYLTCLPTHNTKVSVSAAAAIAWSVACCIRGEKSIEVIINEAVKAANMGAAYGNDIPSASVARRIQLIKQIIDTGTNETVIIDDMYALFGGGDLAVDSIPIAIGLFVLGKGNPKRVNELCVNFGGDCDTNAAMAGAMAGAYMGIDAIPVKWIKTVEAVNRINFDSYATDLIQLSEKWKVGVIP